MQRILRHDLGRDVEARIGARAREPILRNLLLVIGGETGVRGAGDAEEGRNGGQIGRAAVGGEKLVEKGGGAVEEQGFDAVVEVFVFGEGLLVALEAVESEILAVKVGGAGAVHHSKEGSVEGVVVAVSEEEVVAG